MGKAFFVCLCLAAGLAAAGCSAQGVAAGGEAEPYSLSLVTVGPGTVSGFPKSAEAGSTVTFLPEKTRGDAETVSAALTVGGGAAVPLEMKADGSFGFAMPKRNVTVTVTFSLVFPYDDTTIAETETLFVKIATDTTFLLSKNADDWTDAPEGLLECDYVLFDGLTGNRAAVVTTEPDLEPAAPVSLTFSDANLAPNRAPLAIKDGAAALVTMEGTNTFAPTVNNSAGILVTPGSALTLTGPEGAALAATGNGGSNYSTAAAGIGGSFASDNGGGGDITITGHIKVVAKGGYNGAGIGAAYATYGGTITIGGNADVTATAGDTATGIGGGWGGAGGVIIIKENARVTGKGGNYRPGIGGTRADGEKTQITILGNARVYGQSGGASDGAGIGSGDGDNSHVSGAKITIGDGTDNPLVIARGSSGSDQGGAASGLGGGGTSKASKVYIEIKSGTVIAQSNRAGGAAIGAQNPSADSYVKITGGAVYAVNSADSTTNTRLTRPAAVGADDTTLVYPLYAAAAVAGPIRVPFAPAAYTAPVFDSRVTEFITFCDLDASTVFPGLASLASELWVPAGTYSTIKAGSATKSATVDASYPEYSAGMTTNLIQ